MNTQVNNQQSLFDKINLMHRSSLLLQFFACCILFYFAFIVSGLFSYAPNESNNGTPLTTKPISDIKSVNPFAKLPLYFEENQGQTNKNVQFISRGAGYTLFFTEDETVLSLSNQQKGVPASVMRMRLQGENKQPMQFTGKDSLLGEINYLIGSNKSKWLQNVKSYKDIVATGVYPGIDLRYHGDQQQLEYDFIVAPGADADVIRMSFSGLKGIHVDLQGRLQLETTAGIQLTQNAPIVYQDIEGERVLVGAKYLVLAANDKDQSVSSIGFQVASYNPEYPLIIDPVLDYSTYLGAAGNDRGLSVTTDDNGDVYVAGTTKSAVFPTLNLQENAADNSRKAFVAKLNKAGDAFIYATYVGGSEETSFDDDVKNNSIDIAVDDLGYAYIIGTTQSTDFPTVNAIQASYGGGGADAFLSKLSPTGDALIFSTYLGGAKRDKGYGVALDASRDIYITGKTRSFDFPTMNALQANKGGHVDAFIAKIDTAGQGLIYSTYLGGSEDDTPSDIAVNSQGQVVLTGMTNSSIDFPLFNAMQTVYSGGNADAFISTLASDGQSFEFSTYFGGSQLDEANGVAIDRQDNIIVVGETKSVDFPVLNAFQTAHSGAGRDGFISKLSADGNTIAFSTYFGGNKKDVLRKVAVDAHDDIYVVGFTKSTTGLATNNAIQSTLNGTSRDVVIAKLTTGGDQVLYGTYFGGTALDDGYDIAVDKSGNAYITGITKSATTFPLQNAIQPQFGGGKDAFIVKIAEPIRNAAPVISSTPLLTLVAGDLYQYDVGADDTDNDVLSYQLTNSPTGMSIDNDSGLISWSPNSAQSVDVIAVVEDAFGGQDTQNFTIVITSSNTAPSIVSTPQTAAIVGQSYTYDVNATDTDGDSLLYELNLAPAGMVIDSASGQITWQPSAIGDVSVVVRVSDGAGGQTTQNYSITVINPDTTPPIISISNPLNGSVTSQALITLTGQVNEAAILSINGQSFATNPDNTFSIVLDLLQEGINITTLSATDTTGNTSTLDFTITFDTVSPQLTITAPIDGSLTNQSDVNFIGQVSEAATLTINGQLFTLGTDHSFNVIATLSEGSNLINIVATDLGGNTGSQPLTITLDTTPPAQPDTGLITRGNPANGIIMINGQPGSVEPGSLVHVTNPLTGYEATELAQSDGSFATDVSGFANDSFVIYTTDAGGNSSPNATLLPSAPAVLTLDAIGDKTALLGQKTRFTVTANDSQGNKVALGLTPTPLPQGMKFNVTTGEFTFTPNTGQEGNYNLTFSATSGDERVTESIAVNVPSTVPNAPTILSGRILDANSMQEPTIVPIVGATVSFLGSGVSTTTDAQGYFVLSNLPIAAEVFDIDTSTAQPGPSGVTYAAFREQYHLVANVDNLVERPFYLPRLATESLTTVNPAQTTVVENTTIGVSISIAPGNATNDSDGTPFTGQVSISEVPRNLAPANLPEFIDPNLLFTVQPVGVSYTTPAPITLVNNEGYAADSEVDIWSVDPDLGQFVIVGTGKVSSDGLTITTISGGLRANDWHATASSSSDPDPSNPPPDPFNDCKGCPSVHGASKFSLHDGHMSTSFSLPSYRSLEASRSVSFNYRSFRAYPRPSVSFNGINSVRNTVPRSISYSLEVAGLLQGEEVFVNTSGFSESQDEPFRTAISFDASNFTTGLYDYRLKVTNNYAGGTKRSLFVNGKTLVNNEQQSPFGAGWMINGLYKLAFNTDLSVTLISPAARSITYLTTATVDVYASPDNDYASFIRNPDGRYTHTEKNGIKMVFNDQGLLVDRIDRNGNTTNYTYDINNRLINITDPVGLITVLAYDNNGLLSTITDPANRVTTFTFDATGNLTKASYPDNTFETFEYDGRHLITAHEDERQNRFTDRYDVFGRVIDGTLPDGTVRTAISKTATGLVDISSGVGTAANPAPVTRPNAADGEYTDGRGNSSSKMLDPHGRTTLQIDELGRTTTHVRDADSNATQTTRPIGSVVNRTFDNFGNVLTKTEQFNGATTTYTYDAFSLVKSVTNPNNHTNTINRDPITGNPLSIVNHLGHTSTLQYDSRGLLTQSTSPNGLVTTYSYNTQGLMQTKTETPPALSPGNVRVTTFGYFSSGLLQTVNTPDGITLNYVYDQRSMLVSVTDNLNQSINYTYDDHKNIIKTETNNADGSLALLVDSVYDNRNRLTQTSAPHNATEASISQRVLDENSNLTSIIDPNGNSSSNQYDAFNRLDSNTHRENGITQYTYDDQDRIINVIAPNGVVTQYQYDIISRRTKEISSDRGTISYTYDLANNVTSITEGRGIVASMSYDELERLTTKTYPNTITNKTEDVSYSYDACTFGLGKLCNRTDESGQYQHQYDAYGNLSNTSFTETAGISYSTAYIYDDGDRISQMTLPSGRVIDYQRDGVRRIQQIDTTLNGVAQNIVRNVLYRGDNQMQQCTFGNNLVDTRNYDLQGRLQDQQLATASNTVIDQRNYSYDKNSNILNIDSNTEDNAYNYDKLDRIIGDTISNNPAVNSTPIGFNYDLNNNRLSKILTDSSNDEQYQHQSNNNRLSQINTLKIGTTPLPALANRDMVYNNVGRLYQLVEEGTLKAEYLYNDAGQRTRKTIYQTDGITVNNITIYHYDQMGYLVTETTPTGQLIKDYIWQEGMTPLAQIDDNNTTESIVYLYTDHLMTNRLATNELQQVVWTWEGEAFGNTPAEELTATQVNLRFPGQYFDQETNLHYNHFRYYDPSLGRYITSDPIGLDGGMDTYGYVSQNSIIFNDPTGEYINPVGALFGGGGELGIQLFKHMFKYGFTTDCLNIDWADVAVATAAGAFFPGAGKLLGLNKTYKAKRNLERQRTRVRASSRRSKLAGRINNHRNTIINVAGGFVAGQVGKYVGKKLFDDGNSNIPGDNGTSCLKKCE